MRLTTTNIASEFSSHSLHLTKNCYMKKYLYCLFALLVICTGGAQAQNRIRPRWINNTPISSNENYYFVNLHSDASSSLAACRAAVLKELTANVERVDRVTIKESYKDHSTMTYSGGNIGQYSQDTYDLKLEVEGSPRPIKYRRIDDYQGRNKESGRDCYYALYAVEKFGCTADFSTIRVTSKYGAKALALSNIPGCGQFYKGAYLKGGLMLGGCAVLAGGIIFTEHTRADYVAKIAQTHNTQAIRTYTNKRNHFATARNICIGAAAALYVYNLIDAIATPGARRVVVKKGKNSQRRYAFAPTISEYGRPMLTTSITF